MFRQKRAFVSAVCLIVVCPLIFALAGCEAKTPRISSSPKPSVKTNVAVTDDEAARLVESAYADYLSVSDQIYSEGGTNANRIDEVARGDAAEEFKSAASDLSAKQFRTLGTTTADSIQIQTIDSHSGGVSSITAYLCSDVSTVDVVDVDGASMVSPDRNARTPYQIVVEIQDSKALISSRVVWVGDNFC